MQLGQVRTVLNPPLAVLMGQAQFPAARHYHAALVFARSYAYHLRPPSRLAPPAPTATRPKGSLVYTRETPLR